MIVTRFVVLILLRLVLVISTFLFVKLFLFGFLFFGLLFILFFGSLFKLRGVLLHLSLERLDVLGSLFVFVFDLRKDLSDHSEAINRLDVVYFIVQVFVSEATYIGFFES